MVCNLLFFIIQVLLGNHVLETEPIIDVDHLMKFNYIRDATPELMIEGDVASFWKMDAITG